jgi:hypothetical protein
MNPQDKLKAETKEARKLLARIERFVTNLESDKDPIGQPLETPAGCAMTCRKLSDGQETW